MTLKSNWQNGDSFSATDANAIASAVNAAEVAANKGASNGYASLDSNGKVPVSQLPNSVMEFQGMWNPATNTPTLSDSAGNAGDVYRVSTDGSRDLGSGSISFNVGDYIIYSGSVWQKADTTDAVATVNGQTGNVSLTKSDVGLGSVDNTSDAEKNSATASLTNKTVNLSYNTVTGTTAQFNAALSDNDFATQAGAEVLTNKTISGSSNTLSNIPNGALTNSSITIAGAATSLGGSVSQDAITGLASTGLVKRTGANTLATATSGTDYAPATSGSSLLKGNGAGGTTAATAGTDFVAPGGALGTPSSGTLTNCTGLPVGGISATGTPGATTYLCGDGSWQAVSASASTNTSTSVDSEVTLFSGTGGKTLKRATGSGLAVLSSGVLSTVSAPSGTVVGTTDSQSLSNKTLTNPTVNNYTEGVVAIGTVTTASTIDLTNGTVQTATLTASTACTFTMPTAVAGKSFVLMLKQAASTGNGTATFTGVKWNSAGAPTITATAGSMDILSFFSDGTNWYGSASQGFTP